MVVLLLFVVSYFLTDEKVCKELPRTFRMVLGLPRRPKGETDWIFCFRIFLRFPLRNPFDSFLKECYVVNSSLMDAKR